jgi:hypothetical protein
MTTHLYLVPKLRVRGATPLLPHMPSCRARGTTILFTVHRQYGREGNKTYRSRVIFPAKECLKYETSDSHAHEYEEYLEIQPLNDTV